MRRQATVFGEVAELYHRHRPEYPGALFEWIETECELGAPARVLDVGCGTGKSSSWFVRRGDEVVGIEPDRAMADVALSNRTGPGRLRIEGTAFETWAQLPRLGGASEPFDLAVSGQAWHWAEPATRFHDVADCLGQRGWLCVFWNRPDLRQRKFEAEISGIYEAYADEMVSGLVAVRFPGSKAAISAATPQAEFDQSGRFGPVATHETQWSRSVSTEEHCASLRTQSDHRLLEPARLEQLLRQIAVVIDDHGGAYEQPYTTHGYAAQVVR